MQRYNPDYKTGLTHEQVNKRKEENLINYDTTVKTKSIRSIIISNFFTLFNIMNFVLALLIFFVGAYKNLLFIIIVILNTLISTIQEIYSKRTIDKLSFLAQTKTKVIREGKIEEISNFELVLDDVIELNAGNQIPTDSVILSGEIEVNESLLTGEPDNIEKKKGDKLLSGSYLVSGKCFAKVEHIGKENYVAQISHEAKQKRKVNSEIYFSISLGVLPITSGAPNTYVISSKLIPDHLLADLNGILAITFNSLLDVNFSLTASIVEFLSSEYFPKLPRISFNSFSLQSLY